MDLHQLLEVQFLEVQLSLLFFSAHQDLKSSGLFLISCTFIFAGSSSRLTLRLCDVVSRPGGKVSAELTPPFPHPRLTPARTDRCSHEAQTSEPVVLQSTEELLL